MAGLGETLGHRVYALAGVPSSTTDYFQFRIVDEAEEAFPDDQYRGDLWGLYFVIEHTDGPFLEERGLPAPPSGGLYSVNRGMWGVTIGGKETLGSKEPLPESEWVLSEQAFSAPRSPERHTLGFERGEPVALNGETLDAVSLTALTVFGTGAGAIAKEGSCLMPSST